MTENGAAFADEVAADDGVHDAERTAYLAAHLGSCAAAVADGVPLRGYFAWSLMDNFEWALRLQQAVRGRARRLRDPAADG